MFGIWRTLLALEVVAFHLLPLPFLGRYAVFSFFVLSGFLMTAIMHVSYGYSTGGVLRYLGNRALRLYPGYFYAVLVSLLVIAVLGSGTVRTFNPAMAVPDAPGEWLANLTMAFPGILPRQFEPRLVPITWALTIEIFYYVAIGLGVSRSRHGTWLWLAASVVYTGIAAMAPARGGEEISVYLYSAIPAASLPFAAGALTWHYREVLGGWIAGGAYGGAVSLIVARWAVYLGLATINAFIPSPALVLGGLWLNIAASALIVAALNSRQGGARLRDIDIKVGNFSYPIYLLHLQAGIFVAYGLFGREINERSWQSLLVFVLGLTLTLLLALVPVRAIDPAIEHLRTRLRGAPAAAV